MNVAIAHPKHAIREKLASAMRARGLQVFSVPDVAGLLDASTQARLSVVLVDTKLLLKETVNVRLRVQAHAGYALQVVALTNKVADDETEIFQKHGATLLEHPLDSTAEVADWVKILVERLTSGGRGGDSGGHWQATGREPKGTVLAAEGAGPEILVVEDEPTFRSFLCEALSLEGYKVWAAPDGEEALKFFQANDAALVISDINMPGMDGFELKQQIDNWKKAPVPFLMMTADSNTENAQNAAAVGVVFIVGKPIRNLDAFYAIVREALRKGEAQKAPAG